MKLYFKPRNDRLLKGFSFYHIHYLVSPLCLLLYELQHEYSAAFIAVLLKRLYGVS